MTGSWAMAAGGVAERSHRAIPAQLRAPTENVTLANGSVFARSMEISLDYLLLTCVPTDVEKVCRSCAME